MVSRALVIVTSLTLALSACREPASSSAPATPAPSPPSPSSPVPEATSPAADGAPALPVLLRIENASGAPFEDAFVHTTTLRTFGGVPPSGKSEYLPFESMIEAPHVAVAQGGHYLERSAAQADTLKIGRYTLRLSLADGRLTSFLTRDEGTPTRAELLAAFRAADAPMTTSLARAYAFLRRADTVRCGEEHGAKGRAQLAFFVAPSGRTGGVDVMSHEHEGTAVERCLIEAVKSWRLPRFTGAMPPPLVVEVPLSLP